MSQSVLKPRFSDTVKKRGIILWETDPGKLTFDSPLSLLLKNVIEFHLQPCSDKCVYLEITCVVSVEDFLSIATTFLKIVKHINKLQKSSLTSQANFFSENYMKLYINQFAIQQSFIKIQHNNTDIRTKLECCIY